MKSLSLTFVMMFLSAGCLMTRQEVAEREQGRGVQDQVMGMQRSAKKDIEKNVVVDQELRVADFNEEMRLMSGRVDMVENRLAQLQSERDREQKQEGQSVEEVSRRLSLLQEEMTKLTTVVSSLNADVASLKAGAAKPVASKGNTFDEAEGYFAQKDWKKAIFNYQKYRDENAKGKKFAEATYKIGVSFQELGMKDEAKAFFEEVNTKFPQSNMATKARIRLKKIK